MKLADLLDLPIIVSSSLEDLNNLDRHEAPESVPGQGPSQFESISTKFQISSTIPRLAF